MGEIISNKRYLLNICQLLYRQFIGNESMNNTIDELGTDVDIYDTVYEFIRDKLSHDDDDVIDFIYSCFYETANEYNDRIMNINSEDLIIPKLRKMKGTRFFTAQVRYIEDYTHTSYMPIMLESLIYHQIIDEDSLDTEIIDMWDFQIDVDE